MENVVQIIVSGVDDASHVFRSIRRESGEASAEAKRSLKDLGAELRSVGGAVQGVGTDLTKFVTIPLTALGVGAAKAAADWELAMTGVAKTVDATAAELAVLGDAFIDLSEDIPVSAGELAKIGEAAGQLGIEKSNLLGFTRVMADLGVTTNLSSEEAATALARLANITQMPQTEFDRLGATVVELGNNLATTEREIVEMGLRIAGAGKQVGLTEAQILGLAGALSSVGIEAQAGGTAISRTMVTVAQAVEAGGSKLEQFAVVAGMSSDQFRVAFEQDAATAIVTFIEGLGRMSNAGQSVFGVLEDLELQDIRVRDALLRAAGAGDLMRKSLELGSVAWAENTALTAEADKFYAALTNQFKVLLNEAKNTAAALGGALRPAIDLAMDAARKGLEVIGGLVEWFGQLSPGIRIAVAAMAALAAAVGPVLVVAGSLIGALGGIVAAVGVLTGGAGFGALAAAVASVAAPVAATVGIVAALGAGLVAVWQHSEEFREVVTASFEGVRDAVIPLVDEVRETVEVVFERISDFWEEWGDEILNVVEPIFSAVVEVVEGAVRVIANVIGLVLNVIQGDWDGAWKNILGIFSAVWDAVLGVGREAVELLKGVLVGGVKAIGATLQKAVEDLVAPFRWVYDQVVGNSIIPDLVNEVGSEFVRMKNQAVDTARTMGDGVVGEMQSLAARGVTAVEQLVLGVRRALYEGQQAFATFASNARAALANLDFNAVGQSVQTFVGQSKSALGNLAQAGLGALRQAMDEAKEKAGETGVAMGAFSGSLDSAASAAKKARDEIAGMITDLEEEVATLGMSSRELLEYELRKKGATDATVAQALALQDEVAAFDDAQRAIKENRDAVENLVEELEKQAEKLGVATKATIDQRIAELDLTAAQRERITVLRDQIAQQEFQNEVLRVVAEENKKTAKAERELAREVAAAQDRIEGRLKGIITDALPSWASGWEEHWQLAKDIMTVFEGDIGGILESLLGSFGGWLQNLLGMFQGGFGGILDLGKKLLGGLGGIFEGGFGGLLGKAGGFLGKIGGLFDGGFGGILGKATGFVKDFGGKLLGGLGLGNGVFGSVAKFMGGPWGAAIITGLDLLGIDVGETVAKIGKVAVDGLKVVGEGIIDAGGALLNTYGAVLGGIGDAVGAVLGIGGMSEAEKIAAAGAGTSTGEAARLFREQFGTDPTSFADLGRVNVPITDRTVVQSESLQRARDAGLIGYDPRTDPSSPQYNPGFAAALRGGGGSSVTRIGGGPTGTDRLRAQSAVAGGTVVGSQTLIVKIGEEEIGRRVAPSVTREIKFETGLE